LNERGAFTGADRAREGLFEVAHEGTLFLDEAAELSLPAQAKLLRVLTDGLVARLGSCPSSKPVPRELIGDFKARVIGCACGDANR
jgi:transcriptional regulator with PAS, ATPase and Fis domain